MKRFLFLVCVLTLSLPLSGCGEADGPETAGKLVQRTPEQVVADAKKLMESSDPEERAGGCIMLGNAGTPQAKAELPALQKMLNDPSPVVKASAQQAIALLNRK